MVCTLNDHINMFKTQVQPRTRGPSDFTSKFWSFWRRFYCCRFIFFTITLKVSTSISVEVSQCKKAHEKAENKLRHHHITSMVCTYRAIKLARNRSVIVKLSKLPLAVLEVNYYFPSFHGYQMQLPAQKFQKGSKPSPCKMACWSNSICSPGWVHS